MSDLAPIVKAVAKPTPIEVFHSDRIADVAGLDVLQQRTRSVSRARLREIVPSGTWYDQATHDAGVKFPVPGMIESKAITWFPYSSSRHASKASKRMMSPFSDEDRFDLLTRWQANDLRLPPAWSMELAAGIRPYFDRWANYPIRNQPTIRSVTLAKLQPRIRTKHTAHGPVDRKTVRCRYPQIFNAAPQGAEPKWVRTGRRLVAKTPLTKFWPIDAFPVVIFPKPQAAAQVSSSENQ